MIIRKAVIAAAGRGTRFLPVTKAYPKELLPVVNKPIIHHLIEELIGSGINRIAVVHRWHNDLVPNYFKKDRGLQNFLKSNGKENLLSELNNHRKALKELIFIPQPTKFRYGTGSPILAAREFIGSDPFVYAYGDDLILEPKTGAYLSSLIELFDKKTAAILGVQKVEWGSVRNFGTISFKKGGQVLKICEKSGRSQAPSNYALFGRFVLYPEVIRAVENLKPGKGAELMLTEALNSLAKTGRVFFSPLKNGRWLTTGDPESWHKANVEFINVIKKGSQDLGHKA